MFATRFDPSSIIEDQSGVKTVEDVIKSNKRKLESDDSENEAETDSEEDRDSEVDSDSEGDSNSEESSDDEENNSHNSNTELVSIETKDEIIVNDNNEIRHIVTSQEDEDIDMDDKVGVHDSKFSSIISRFNKSIAKSSNEVDNDESDSDEEILDQHNLAPLPQPELPRDHRLSRSYTNNNLSWLTKEPIYIKPEEVKPFSEFPLLSPKILNNLQTVLEFDNAFATQIKTLELLLPELSNTLNPKRFKGDLLVNASTGSGKTLAYSIPIIQSLQNRIVPKLSCIIIVPTKPLINQVYRTLVALSRGISINIVTLGTKDVSLKEESKKLLSNIPDIVISTPGRLVDHLNLESLSLKHLQWCIVDEADRLLNQSFQDWSNTLISRLNEVFDNSQNNNISQKFSLNFIKMIFSATLTTDPGKLTNLKFNNPRLIVVNDQEKLLKSDKKQIFSLPLKLQEFNLKFSSSSSSIKPLLLLKLINNKLVDSSRSNVLIFTNSNESTIRLSRLLFILQENLKLTINISNINSSMSKSQISKNLEQFSQGKINVLISTDLIARGIDILSIKHVINYDLPNSSREYVHRVGRTARANQNGFAYNFLIGKGEEKFFKSFEMDINRNDNDIRILDIDEIEQDWKDIYKASLKQLESEVYKK
ncbi:hypothetical protein WICMUC_005627 [Wickerhamomyces mucosus]|uniref:ATP-dependent RNA helicase n=1 Tax=Wickerhamomyces mucosus TaxID=1378264 RepID=A0A9P8T525_9ASCO|nr:hypothetical protein WICMUC_005627 [Wickerhamomyces mucosus]